VLADTVTAGGGTVKINLQGGLLAVTNTLGTLASPLNALTLDQGATLQFWVTNHLTNAAVNAISSDNTGSITISAVPVYLTYPAQFPLLACAHSGASGITFSVGTLPGTCQGYIYNDNSNTIWLVITNGPPLPKTDRWSGGVNGDWDTNSLNWTNNGSAVTYRENDLVIFDDSAQTGAVSLTGNAPHTPYAWAVTNNAHAYTFGGTNRISGDTGLTKSGGNSLTLAESGDSFSGGIKVNGGTLILDEPTNNISGGLFIASGATAQIGNGDDKGNLPGGAITNNGTLDFSQTITNVVSAGISGTGTLRQNGSGTVELISPVTGTGNTVVLQGKLAVIGSGSIANSANVIISNATLDISGATGTALAGNLNLTNSTLALGGIPVNVAGLNLGGSSNVINLSAATLPGVFAYPTNFTLLQSASAISGYNFVLGSLPDGLPAYAGSLAQVGNAVVLNLNTGPVIMASATVTFAATNPGYALNPAFCGLSYEKDQLTGSLFVSNNTSLISMFSQIGPAVLRIGGNSVDTTCWGGVSNLTPITAAQVSAFAGFVHALPTNWHVLYGLNMSVNSPTNCAAEAAYAANALGSSLLGFEIGNECDLYHGNGLRPTNFTYAEFLSEWQTLAGAITNTVPGWAITNGGSGWVFTGPVSAYNTSGYTVPFAANEQGVNSMLTQHYYRANGQDTNSTIAFLLTPDASLPGEVSTLAAAATANGLPDGFRMAECGSYYNGGAPNVSDAYGTALWALDYMFTIALNGGQGINFHGGGDGPGYTPIADNGTAVVQARPEFYGLKMFSLLCQGSAIPATITLTTNINFTAYGVRRPDGGISALLNNKQTNYYVQAAINLGSNVTAAQSISLAGPNLNATNGYTLGGAEINADGSWAGGVQSIIPASNGQLTFLVPPITAVLLNPVAPPVLAITSPAPGQHVTNALATLSGTAGDNQGVAEVWYQLDGGAWRLAATTNHWTNWTATVPLIAGTNTMAAYAVNLAGLDSPTNGLSVVSSNTFKLQLEIARAEPLTTNGLNFSLDLTAGVNGYIQVTTDLLSDWTTLADFTGSNSLLNFRDPAATNFNHRFYRAVIP
jgi:autotransporter-associated beta strand protein